MTNSVPNAKKRVLVLGFDGATFDLLKPWIEQSKLPNFKRIMTEGIHGRLQSTIPPVTGPAWVSFATGKNPGKHGCFDFSIYEESLNKGRVVTTEDIKSKTFYEILYERGKKCIIINLPCSDPPRIPETVLTCFLTKGEQYVYPSRLLQEIPELKTYRILPDMSLLAKQRIKDYVSDIADVEKGRFNCAKKLFRRDWDFFFLLFSGSDWIQHQLYGKLLSNPERNIWAVHVYEELDGYLGWFLDNLPENTNVIVMSDHGFHFYERKFAINTWLVNEGYLKIKSLKIKSTTKYEDSLGVHARKISTPMFLLKHSRFAKAFAFFYRIIGKVIPIRPSLDVEPDISKSVAFSAWENGSAMCGDIHINLKSRFADGVVNTEDYDPLRNEIIQKLAALRDERTGEKVFTQVLKKEDVYAGKYLVNAPDIVVISNGYEINRKFIPLFFEGWPDNNHALEGILICFGPDIAKNKQIKGAKILDLAPTILFMLGMQIPSDIDGRVLKELFEESSKLAKEPIAYEKTGEQELLREKRVFTSKDEEKVKERLRKLGYL